MIYVTRVAKPSVLQREEAQRTDDLCKSRVNYYRQLAQYEADQLVERSKRSVGKPKTVRAKNAWYAHNEIKTALNNMFHGKCAYCEARIEHITWKQVEHFRPQSIYPKLAYAWNNLLVACPLCNNAKLAQFPLIDGTQPIEDRVNPCSLDESDEHVLINPCEDDPSQHFSFQDQYITYDENDLRAEKSCKVYGLNREKLKDEREKCLIRVVLIAKAYLLSKQHDVSLANEFAGELKQSVDPEDQFSAMNHAKIVAMGIDPDTL